MDVGIRDTRNRPLFSQCPCSEKREKVRYKGPHGSILSTASQIMADSRWLSIFRNEEGRLFLHEDNRPYRHLDGCPKTTVNIVTIVRGQHARLRWLPRPGHQVHLWSPALQGSSQSLVADCSLALLHGWPRVDEICQRGNLIPVHRPGPVQDLAPRLYAQLLVPLSRVVVFFAREHGSLESIIHDLAIWVLATPQTRPSQHHGPRVVIFTRIASNREAMESELEKQLAIELVKADATHTFSTAVCAWRRIFEGIRLCEEHELPYRQLLTTALAVSGPLVELKARQLKRAFQAACAHFAADKSWNLLQASRVEPMSAVLPTQIDHVFSLPTKKLPNDIKCRLAASTLMIDSFDSFITVSTPSFLFESPTERESRLPAAGRLRGILCGHGPGG